MLTAASPACPTEMTNTSCGLDRPSPSVADISSMTSRHESHCGLTTAKIRSRLDLKSINSSCPAASTKRRLMNWSPRTTREFVAAAPRAFACCASARTWSSSIRLRQTRSATTTTKPIWNPDSSHFRKAGLRSNHRGMSACNRVRRSHTRSLGCCSRSIVHRKDSSSWNRIRNTRCRSHAKAPQRERMTYR